MHKANCNHRLFSCVLLWFCLKLFIFTGCRTSDQQNESGIPENIARNADISIELENFTFGGDNDFLDNNFDIEGNFLTENSAEDTLFAEEEEVENSNGFFGEFSNNIALQESLENGSMPLEFNQTPEEVNSSLSNDTQIALFNEASDVNSFIQSSADEGQFAANIAEAGNEFFAVETDVVGEENSFLSGDLGSNTVVPVFENNVTGVDQELAAPLAEPSPPMMEQQPFEAELAGNQLVEAPEVPEAVEEPRQLDPQFDIFPTFHVLSWVGYEVNDEERKLQVEIITRGNPEFQVFQESNRAGQAELVIRFLETKLRPKLKWDIDASEFRSPVAYIRMRQDKTLGIVDVVLTLRDSVQPLFYAKDGNILLTFAIPERYYGNQDVAQVEAIDQAQRLSQYQLALDIQEGSDLPKVSYNQPDPGQGVFDSNDNPAVPIDQVMEPAPEFEFDSEGFPPSFDTSWLESPGHFTLEDFFPAKQFHIQSNTVFAVGQDDGDNFDLGDEEPFVFEDDNFTFDDDFANVGEPQSDEGQNEEQEQEQFQAQEQQEMQNGDFNFSEGQLDDFGESMNAAPAANSFFETEPAANMGEFNTFSEGTMPVNEASDFFLEPQNPASGMDMFSEESLSNAEISIMPEATSMDDGFSELPQATELVGRESSSPNPPEYDGRLVYMEFTDAPLSIVFKTFSAETNNNFVFPKEVGDLPVTIHFQGVPWDEALKGILETHSLGMVRVGSNIVRVDGIDKLTAYMQKLEEAKQFESRRIPTKVLVMRLNNAKAPDILERITPILERDREIDPRIRIAADERTNSLVMEAPEYILSKTKNVVERLDLETPQVEIASRIVEVQKNNNDSFGVAWINRALANFDPGRGLGFGSLNFPNNLISNFAVDPGVRELPSVGNAQFRFGSINRFIDLDLILRMEERRGTTNILQSNRVLVLDGQEALILAGNSKFFRPAAGGTVVNQGDAAGNNNDNGLAEVKFNLSLEVRPQVTADGSVIMDLNIKSDTPADPTGEVLADKNTRELKTQMIRESGDTGVIGGIYDTQRIESIVGVPFFSRLPIIGALFRATNTTENQTEMLIMVTPTIVSGKGSRAAQASADTMGGSRFASSDDPFAEGNLEMGSDADFFDGVESSGGFDLDSNFDSSNAAFSDNELF